jgi:eukaryotic-like serine/threonine-protein kinase
MSAKVCPKCNAQYDADERYCRQDGALLKRGEDTGFAGRELAGRYRLIRRLGSGGMGNVYLAEHVRLKSLSAIKLIRPSIEGDPRVVARFTREARTASQIRHPNVATVFDFGDADDGMVFLVMEYVEGDTLAELCRREPLTPHRTTAIVWQIASALAAAHERGIVHRDLKPENVMITRTPDGSDIVKLVDFGIAKNPASTDQKITATGAIMGSAAYMSPEQANGELLDARSDVYALGILTFHLLTRDLPFDGATAHEQITARLSSQPKRLASVAPASSWNDQVQAVLDRALAVNRDDRFATALDFAHALDDAIRAPRLERSS